jgi:hypothetical protein
MEGVWNRVLRRISVPKRKEMESDWRRLHNEELHNVYASPNITEVMKSRGHEINGAYSTHGKDKKCLQNFYPETPREETTWKT